MRFSGDVKVLRRASPGQRLVGDDAEEMKKFVVDRKEDAGGSGCGQMWRN